MVQLISRFLLDLTSVCVWSFPKVPKLFALGLSHALSKTCSKWARRQWRQICIHCAKLSITRAHSSLGISLIFAVIFRCLQFTNRLTVVVQFIILEVPPEIKIGGYTSGECGAHSISHFLLISLPSKRSFNKTAKPIWITFRKENDIHTKWSRLLKVWGMIANRLKF